MSVTTTSAEKTWPTAAEFAGVLRLLEQAVNDIDALSFRGLVDLDVAPSIEEDAPPVSLEYLGALSRFVALAELDIDSLQSDLRNIKGVRDAIGMEIEEVTDAS